MASHSEQKLWAHSPWKRLLDMIASGTMLLLLSPLILIVACCISIIDGKPIFFCQTRVGLNGSLFKLVKFRSMRDSSDKNQVLSPEGDKRITRLGQMLRSTKLDELPQLWNVLKGDMTLVGYRPELPYFVAFYGTEERPILNFKPGIVDPATLAFANESELLSLDNTEEDYINLILPHKIQLSLHYAKTSNFWTDIKCWINLCMMKLFNPFFEKAKKIKMFGLRGS